LSFCPPLFPTRSRAPLLSLPQPVASSPRFLRRGAGWGRRRRARPPPDPPSGADPLPPARIPARGSMAGRRRAAARRRGRPPSFLRLFLCSGHGGRPAELRLHGARRPAGGAPAPRPALPLPHGRQAE
jgi:hypothetical protein